MVLIFGAANTPQNITTKPTAVEQPVAAKLAPVPAPMQASACGGNPVLGKENTNKKVESKSLGGNKSLGLSYEIKEGLKCDGLEISWPLLSQYTQEGQLLLRGVQALFPFPKYRTSSVYPLQFGGYGLTIQSPEKVQLAKILVRNKFFNTAKMGPMEAAGLMALPMSKSSYGTLHTDILTIWFSPAVLAGYTACGKDYDADIAKAIQQLMQHPLVVASLPLVHRCDVALDTPGLLKDVLVLQSSVQAVLKKNGYNAYYLNRFGAICITFGYDKTLHLADVYNLTLPVQLTRIEQRQKFAPPIHLQRLLPALRALSRTTAYNREQAMALMLASSSPHIRKLALLRDWEQLYFRFAHDAHARLDKYQYAKLLTTLKPALVPEWGQCAAYQSIITQQFANMRTMQAIASGYGGKFEG